VADEVDATRLREPRDPVYPAEEARPIIVLGDPAVVEMNRNGGSNEQELDCASKNERPMLWPAGKAGA
jgi:hypothetical protein